LDLRFSIEKKFMIDDLILPQRHRGTEKFFAFCPVSLRLDGGRDSFLAGQEVCLAFEGGMERRA